MENTLEARIADLEAKMLEQAVLFADLAVGHRTQVEQLNKVFDGLQTILSNLQTKNKQIDVMLEAITALKDFSIKLKEHCELNSENIAGILALIKPKQACTKTDIVN